MAPHCRICRICPDLPDSGDLFQTSIPLQTSFEKSTLGPPLEGVFQGFARKGPQRTPGPPGRPKGDQGHPKGSQRAPKRAKSPPTGRPMASQSVPECPRGSQKEPMAPPREFKGGVKGGLYTQKLPINRTSGRYGKSTHLEITHICSHTSMLGRATVKH